MDPWAIGTRATFPSSVREGCTLEVTEGSTVWQLRSPLGALGLPSLTRERACSSAEGPATLGCLRERARVRTGRDREILGGGWSVGVGRSGQFPSRRLVNET